MSDKQDIWLQSPGGILYPGGQIRESSQRSKTTLLNIKGNAEAVQALYDEEGISLPQLSGLGRFIERAKAVADQWVANPSGETKFADVFAAMHMFRIAHALLPIKDHPQRRKYLNRLTSGEVDFFKRVESDAKNVLWELEFWTLLRSRKGAAELQDPPDIVLELQEGRLGIACKKIYSEQNFEKTLSGAVAQVKGFEIGIAAVNIDDLLPPDSLVRARSEREMARVLQKPCEEFLQRHERHLRRYLSQERLVAVVVSANAIADVEGWEPRLNNAYQAVIWVLPDLSPVKRALLDQFGKLLL